MQATVAMSKDFLRALFELPRSIQQNVPKFIDKFRKDPTAPGLNYEKVKSGGGKMFSVRVDDTYRVVGTRQKESGIYLLLWIDHHDEAYDWAKRHKVEVNAQTDAIQLYNVEECERLASAANEHPELSLFAAVSDKNLTKLGVPPDALAAVRAMTRREDLELHRNALPEDAYECLEYLANEFSVEEVLELMPQGVGNGGSEGNYAQALENPQTRRSFVVVEGDELRRILERPLEEWRVFLHPLQSSIVKKNFNGPARVLGGAGTGKTVVAMHRALRLADALKAPGKEILFTTFGSTLKSDIQANLERLCTSEQLSRIEVTTLDSWVMRFLKRKKFNYGICYEDKQLDGLWERAIKSVSGAGAFPVRFYKDEWERVVLANEVSSLDDYASVERTGRGRRLTRKERVQIWPVFEEYIRLLQEKRIRDAPCAIQEAYLALREMPNEKRYSHVIVDEAQDFSAPALRLIRELAGEQHENDIFIAGDAHQRIYGRIASLSKCGIDVRGRSNTLHINYRTTEEIHKQAMAVLEGISFDDLDEGTDDGAVTQSLTHGELPVFRWFKNAEEECDFICSEIRASENDPEDLRNVCVVVRRNDDANEYDKLLRERGLKTFRLKSKEKADDPNQPGIRIATMHRVKGLEFDRVFVANVSQGVVPPGFRVKQARKEGELGALLTEERSLLYVAMTRAKIAVYVTGVRPPSKLVASLVS